MSEWYDHEWNIRQLTHEPYGHTLNRRQVFSPDGRRVYYDLRNADDRIISTTAIECVDIETGIVERVYEVAGASDFGPGVGAVSCHPFREEIVFIHGLFGRTDVDPYRATTRFGALIHRHVDSGLRRAETRCIHYPIPWGALSGGTHAHSWSGDGRCISFTYNDARTDRIVSTEPRPRDLRTVGVMMPQAQNTAIGLQHMDNENFVGEYWASLVAPVTDAPEWGSNQIDWACEECWIGTNGYARADGTRISRAIAYQGRTYRDDGTAVNEVFVADLFETVDQCGRNSPPQSDNERLPVWATQSTRRISNTATRKYPGLFGPRNWLTSSPDGTRIYCLIRDDRGIVQLFRVETATGLLEQITELEHSIQDQITISPDGGTASTIANDTIHLIDLNTGSSRRLSGRGVASKPVGAIHFIPRQQSLVWNEYDINGWLQIFYATPI